MLLRRKQTTVIRRDPITGVADINEITQLRQATPKLCASRGEAFGASPVQCPPNFVSEHAKRAILGVSRINAIRKKAPVLRVHDEQQAIQKYETILSTEIEISVRREIVPRRCKKPSDAQLQRIEHSSFQVFAYSKRIF